MQLTYCSVGLPLFHIAAGGILFIESINNHANVKVDIHTRTESTKIGSLFPPNEFSPIAAVWKINWHQMTEQIWSRRRAHSAQLLVRGI